MCLEAHNSVEVIDTMLARSQRDTCVSSVIEATLVMIVLIPATILSGGRTADWLSCVAVFLTFLHSQSAFNLAEVSPTQGHGLHASRYHTAMFLVKEGFWVLTFFALGSYPLLLSSFLFSTYPFWRKWIRGLNQSSLSPDSSVQARSL